MLKQLVEIHNNAKELVVIGAGVVLAGVVGFKIVNYIKTVQSNKEYIIDAEYEDTVIEEKTN